MATFLAAPPEEVWSWLVRMGGGRAGWYSWDWVRRRRTKRRLHRARVADAVTRSASSGPQVIVSQVLGPLTPIRRAQRLDIEGEGR
jgi:hypothetical protein